MLVVNVKRQSSLLSCPLQGLEVTTILQTRWITYCSQNLPLHVNHSSVTLAADTHNLSSLWRWWWWEALEMFITSGIRAGIRRVASKYSLVSPDLRSAVTWQLDGSPRFSSQCSPAVRSWHRWLEANNISIFSSSQQFECWTHTITWLHTFGHIFS